MQLLIVIVFTWKRTRTTTSSVVACRHCLAFPSKFEEDDKLHSSTSFIVAKKGITMGSTAVRCCSFVLGKNLK
jgi:hypothetical protein